MVKKFHHRAVPSSSLLNRTLDSVKKLMTFHCSAWGQSYGGGLVYQQIHGEGLNYLESDVVDEPGVGWHIPRGTRPSWSCPYTSIMAVHSNASVYRTNMNTLTPAVTGSQLLLNGSSLKAPVCILAEPGYVKSDRLRIEDPGSELITLEPDNWGTPGRGVDSMGQPWASNPASGQLDTPHWKYCVAPEMRFSWWPAVGPEDGAGYGVAGGCDSPIEPEWPNYGLSRNAAIHAIAMPIGLPMELQIGATPRVVAAKCEMSLTGGTAVRRVFSRPTYNDVAVVTETTDNVPIGMALMAGITQFYGEENVPYTHWDVVGNAPAGTYADGKTVVVDVATLLQKMLDLQSSAYDSFALLPSVGVEFLGGPNASAMRGLLGDEPGMAWDEDAGEWFVTDAVHTSLSWTGYGLSPPVVTIELPDSELERCVVARPWPSMG